MQQSMDFIDISHWQGTVDFDALVKTGCIGVIAKASDGTSFVDDQYLYNRDNALAVGLCFASYHYLRHGNVEKQMQHYLWTAMPSTGERVVIDYEEEEDSAGAVDAVDLIEAVEYIRNNRPDVYITVYGRPAIRPTSRRSPPTSGCSGTRGSTRRPAASMASRATSMRTCSTATAWPASAGSGRASTGRSRCRSARWSRSPSRWTATAC